MPGPEVPPFFDRGGQVLGIIWAGTTT